MQQIHPTIAKAAPWIHGFQAVDVHSDELNIVITQGGNRIEIPAEMAARLIRAIELAAVEEI